MNIDLVRHIHIADILTIIKEHWLNISTDIHYYQLILEHYLKNAGAELQGSALVESKTVTDKHTKIHY